MSELISNLNTIESVKLDIKSAIEAKGVSMSGVSFPDYPTAIGSISGGGGGYTLNQIIDGDIQVSTISSTCVEFNTAGCWKAVKSVNLPSCMWIAEWAFFSGAIEYISAPVCAGVGDGAFAVCPSLQEVYLPTLEAVPIQCFYECESLSSVTLTACEQVGVGAFLGCTALEQISLPNCTVVSQQAFQQCYSLTSVYLPNCAQIPMNTFYGCIALSDIILTSCTSIQQAAFQACSSLSQISLPNCTYIGKMAFQGAGLQTLDLPKLLKIDQVQTFAYCSSLSQVHLSVCSFIANYAFAFCADGMSLYLYSTAVCSLGGSAVFYSMSDFNIYVPSSMVESYKAANYWSDFSAQIFSIQ